MKYKINKKGYFLNILINIIQIKIIKIKIKFGCRKNDNHIFHSTLIMQR